MSKTSPNIRHISFNFDMLQAYILIPFGTINRHKYNFPKKISLCILQKKPSQKTIRTYMDWNYTRSSFIYRCLFNSIHHNACDCWTAVDVYGTVIRAICRSWSDCGISTILSAAKRIRLWNDHCICHRHALL